jgi:hypothetical protein
MPTFRATNLETQEVTEYDAELPQAEHLGEEWNLEVVGIAYAAPDAPQDTRKYGGRRRLSKLEFIELLTDTEYVTILTAAKESVQIEAWIRKMELATPDDDGTSIDLDDPRTQGGVQALELIGLIGEGRAEEILNG